MHSPGERQLGPEPRPESRSSESTSASLVSLRGRSSSSDSVSQLTELSNDEPGEQVLTRRISVSGRNLCLVVLPNGQHLIPLDCLLEWCQHSLTNLCNALTEVGLGMAPLRTAGEDDDVHQAVCNLEHHRNVRNKASMSLLPAEGALMYLRVLGLHDAAKTLQPYLSPAIL